MAKTWRAKPYTKPITKRKKKKYCWCCPSCGRKLTAESRKSHYKKLLPDQYPYKADSESDYGQYGSARQAPERRRDGLLDDDELLDDYEEDGNIHAPSESNEDQMYMEVDQPNEFQEEEQNIGNGDGDDVFGAGDMQVASDENEDQGAGGEENSNGMEADNEDNTHTEEDKEIESSSAADHEDAKHSTQEDHFILMDAEDAESGEEKMGVGNGNNPVDEDSSCSESTSEIEEDDDPDQSNWDKYNEMEEPEAEVTGWQQLLDLNEMLEFDDDGNPMLQEVHDIFRRRQSELSEQEKDSILAFKLQLVANMPRRAFDQMRYTFRHRMEISSIYVVTHKLAILSGVLPKYYDCCPGICIAYIGKYAENNSCHHCGEDRRAANGKARRLFCYLPLIPRLQGLFSNPKTVEELLYRHKFCSNGTITDIFDSQHYKNLCQKRVKVDGQELPYCHFSSKNDIAFALCLDSFLLYKDKRGGPSAMPILVQLYNWRPEVRTHLPRLICLGIIPGPRGPKELDTFLIPFEDETATLAHGVPTQDCTTDSEFDLHAYHVFPHGDILAIEKLMKLKGHNAIKPCRGCNIKAVRDPDEEAANKTYYVPLMLPNKTATRDPTKLPMRNHGDWANIDKKIRLAATQKGKDDIAKQWGLKGIPSVGRRVETLDYARGVPWDYMHLLYLNVVKNLVHLWMGQFKGLDETPGRYVLDAEVWEKIGEETEKSVHCIPSAFVRSLGNIYTDQRNYNAEGWAYWFMFLGPILLQNRLSTVYYKHYCKLVYIMKACIEWTLTERKLRALEEDIINWVEQYEKLYYQYNAKRLSVCTLTIHGLLHIPDGIRFCGPVWTNWTFWMERFNKRLKTGLRSHIHPWANLNNRLVRRCQMEAVDLFYGLEDDISATSRLEDLDDGLTFDLYPKMRFKPPRKKVDLDADTKRIVAKYILELVDKPSGSNITRRVVQDALPDSCMSHAKVQLLEGGDLIKTSFSKENQGRDASFVRYEADILNGRTHRIETAPFYGQLIQILECHLGVNKLWGALRKKTLLIAIVRPCTVKGDARNEVLHYTQFNARVAISLIQVKSVVGRVVRDRGWGIIDRSEELARTEFLSNVEGTTRMANQYRNRHSASDAD